MSKPSSNSEYLSALEAINMANRNMPTKINAKFADLDRRAANVYIPGEMLEGDRVDLNEIANYANSGDSNSRKFLQYIHSNKSIFVTLSRLGEYKCIVSGRLGGKPDGDIYTIFTGQDYVLSEPYSQELIADALTSLFGGKCRVSDTKLLEESRDHYTSVTISWE